MVTLTPAEALELVRKNLDELDPNGSIMYDDENGSAADFADNGSMSDIIRRSLPEAINEVQLTAPVTMLEGTTSPIGNQSTSISGSGEWAGYIVTFTPTTAQDYLRLVSFRADKSDPNEIVITDVIEEASPEGRKQLNPYIMGREDRPRLVHLQGTYNPPTFRYYSKKNSGSLSTSDVEFKYVKRQTYSSGGSYTVSYPLVQNVIDYLTGMVLEIYSDQRAQYYFQKASIFKQ